MNGVTDQLETILGVKYLNESSFIDDLEGIL